MRLIIKGLGIYQVVSGLLIIISLLYNVKNFINNYDIYSLVLFFSIILIYINAGWMMLYYSKSGIILSIFIHGLQITIIPGITLYYNIVLAPGFYLTWNNSVNIKFPISLASFSIYESYSSHINLTSLFLISVLTLFLIVEIGKYYKVKKAIKNIFRIWR